MNVTELSDKRLNSLYRKKKSDYKNKFFGGYYGIKKPKAEFEEDPERINAFNEVEELRLEIVKRKK